MRNIIINKKKLGALTNKPYAFQNRPWDLEYIISTDAYDSLGSNIRIDLYGSEIKRILPIKNDIINEDWISNRTRFLFEAFFKWRVNVPFIRKKGKLIQSSWLNCFLFFFLNLWFLSNNINNVYYLGFILDLELDIELLLILKLFNITLGFLILTLNQLNVSEYYLYYINTNFFQDLLEKKIFIFFGINLRLESPMLNIKLKKIKFKNNLIYTTIGNIFNDNLNSYTVGITIKKLLDLLKGKLKFNIFLLKNIKKKQIFLKEKNNNNIILLLGHNISLLKNNNNIYNYLIKELKNLELFNNLKFNFYIKSIEINNYNLINKLYNYKNNLNLNIIYLNLFKLLYQEIYLENKYFEKNLLNINIIYLLNQKNIFNDLTNKFILFQGHHLDVNSLPVNIILPNKILLEKENIFFNNEASLLKVNKAISRSGVTKNDWMIINALYLYSLKIYFKIYKFNLNKKISKKFNHFYKTINRKKELIYYIKHYSIFLYFKNITKNIKNNILNNFLKKKYTILYLPNIILNNKYYNVYNIYTFDRYSRTLTLEAEMVDILFRNYRNIKKKKNL